jgi:hypothetical protein
MKKGVKEGNTKSFLREGIHYVSLKRRNLLLVLRNDVKPRTTLFSTHIPFPYSHFGVAICYKEKFL